MTQTNILILIGLLIFIVAAKVLLTRLTPKADKKTNIYHYGRKNYLMTRAEHEFFDALIDVVGSAYYVFPQMNISALIDENQVTGQDWKSARRHINQKSVDYIICDKASIKPLVAIELDDSSHDAEDRQLRDIEVERIFVEAGLPLVRFNNYKSLTKESIKQKLVTALPQ